MKCVCGGGRHIPPTLKNNMAAPCLNFFFVLVKCPWSSDTLADHRGVAQLRDSSPNTKLILIQAVRVRVCLCLTSFFHTTDSHRTVA